MGYFWGAKLVKNSQRPIKSAQQRLKAFKCIASPNVEITMPCLKQVLFEIWVTWGAYSQGAQNGYFWDANLAKNSQDPLKSASTMSKGVHIVSTQLY